MQLTFSLLILIIPAATLAAYEHKSLIIQDRLLSDYSSNNFSLKIKEIEDINYKIPNLAANAVPISTYLSRYFININNLFRNKRDIVVAYAIVELLKRRNEIENFNKKALYVLIREMTNIETSYITKVVNVFKKEYKYLINEFETKGIIAKHKKSKFFK